MRAIQPLLVLLLLGLMLAVRRRSRLRARMLLLGVLGATLVLVVDPDLSTSLANTLGVGRGVDLVMYLAIVALSYAAILVVSRVRELEETVTALVRAEAIRTAEPPQESPPARP